MFVRTTPLFLNPKSVEVWSYLSGRAPIGCPIPIDITVLEDLRMSRHHVGNCLTRLMRAGKVRRDGRSVYTVLQRMSEDEPVMKPGRPRKSYNEDTTPITHPRVQGGGSVVELDAYRLMEEVPDDTRSITGVLMGDPLPGRDALSRKKGSISA